MTAKLIHYTDFKSPYAYLALEAIYRIEDEYDVDMTWRYYTLNIPSYLDAVDVRSQHNWRKVKYAYMDARRLANRRGLTLYGPKKIFDSVPAGIGLFWAERHGKLRPYLDAGFERFFKRDFAVDEPDAVEAMLSSVGIQTEGFRDFLTGEGRERHDLERAEAEDMGVFGVPSIVLDGEVFWGGDRLWLLEERLKEQGVARKGG